MKSVISPKYRMVLVDKVSEILWEEYKTYSDVEYYLKKWQEWYDDFNANFYIIKKRNSDNIDLKATLHEIDGDTLLKIAIEMGVETPDFIPTIPVFRNVIKSDYPSAHQTFEKAFKLSETEPDVAIGLANSAIESIIKEIMKDNRIKTKIKRNDTLYDLVTGILKEFVLFPNSDMPEEIKTIGSSLLAMCQSIEKLRSEKTFFHGKTEDDYIVTEPLYTFFIINTLTTIGLFLDSFYKTKYPKEVVENVVSFDEDLPF